MNNGNYIPLKQLCTYYEVEMAFVGDLNDLGVIEIAVIGEVEHLHEDRITDLEKAVRLHQELNLNTEAIDVVFHLLRRIDELRQELHAARSRLRRYEG
jgi:hypothetical protein